MMSLISLFGLQPSQVQMPTVQSVAASEKANASGMALTYVPFESRVYLAIERLAAAGYVQTASAGLRPRTRMDCARLIDEAGEQQADLGVDESSLRLLKELAREFALEVQRRDGEPNREAGIESIDVGSTALAGVPLTDGYHSAQTMTNHYRRPYGQGENLYAGISLRAAAGRLRRICVLSCNGRQLRLLRQCPRMPVSRRRTARRRRLPVRQRGSSNVHC
jgi:hypothetical protein